MKSKLKFLGFMVFTALIAFSIAACGDVTGSVGGGNNHTNPQTFTGNKDGAVYVLTISPGRAAVGDSYTLTYTFQNEVKTSSGTVVSVSGVYNYTLQPSIPSGAVSFVITVNNNGHITQIQDTITWNNGTTSHGTGTVNPGTGNGTNPGASNPSGGGKLTVNGIPSSIFQGPTIYRNAHPTTQMELYQAVSPIEGVALSQNETSPFDLLATDGTPFRGTERFFVLLVVTFGEENYFISDVNFINGSATINFRDMTSQDDLPLFDQSITGRQTMDLLIDTQFCTPQLKSVRAVMLTEEAYKE